MVRRPAATGFTPAHSPRQAIRPRDPNSLRSPRVWVCIRDGAGPGLRIAASSTIARRATWTASPGIQRESKSGGTKASKMGWQRRTGLQGRFQAERSHGPVHHESGGRRANLCAASRLCDGPFPEHYEPIESPIDNPFHPQQTHNRGEALQNTGR